MSPDWTGAGWRAELGYADMPVYTPYEAGQQLAALAKQRKVMVVQGTAQFDSPRQVSVQTADGVKYIEFEHCIIACGSRPVQIPGFPNEDPRLLDSTGALQLADIPKRMLVIGGGIIGLEMATVYATLGPHIGIVARRDRV